VPLHAEIHADLPLLLGWSSAGDDQADACGKLSSLSPSAKRRWSDEEDDVTPPTAPEKGEESMKKMLKAFACTGKSALQRAGQLAKGRQAVKAKGSTIFAA
jgi:hypothetical protein